jgi:hypothetical protein
MAHRTCQQGLAMTIDDANDAGTALYLSTPEMGMVGWGPSKTREQS